MATVDSDEYGTTMNCDLCSLQNKTKTASAYCPICDELLCKHCETVHRSNTILKDHQLQTGDVLAASFIRKRCLPVTICGLHKDEQLVYYCNDHEEIICNICKSLTHRKCSLHDIDVEVQKMKDDNKMNRTMLRIDSLRELLEQTKAGHLHDLDVLAKHRRKCETEIKAIKQEFDKLFEQFEGDLLKELSAEEQRLKKEIQDDTKSLDAMLYQTEERLKLLNDCITADDDTALFIEITKTEKELEPIEKTLSEIREELKNLELFFQQSGELNRLKQTPSPFGKIVKAVTVTTSDELNLAVQSLYSPVVEKGRNTGCAFLLDGSLIVCNFDEKDVTLFNKDFSLRCKMSLEKSPWDVAAVNDTTAAVTLPNIKELRIISTKGEPMRTLESVIFQKYCHGVDSCKRFIYVTTYSYADSEIILLSHAGRIMRKISQEILGRCNIQRADYICVDEAGERMFVSDFLTHSVSCINGQGKVMLRNDDWLLSEPCGMAFLDDVRLMICARDFSFLGVFDKDLTKVTHLLGIGTGAIEPYCVAYRSSDNKLVVGDMEGIHIFTLSKLK